MLDAAMRKKPCSLLNCCVRSPAEAGGSLVGWQMPSLSGLQNESCQSWVGMLQHGRHTAKRTGAHTHSSDFSIPNNDEEREWEYRSEENRFKCWRLLKVRPWIVCVWEKERQSVACVFLGEKGQQTHSHNFRFVPFQYVWGCVCVCTRVGGG